MKKCLLFIWILCLGLVGYSQQNQAYQSQTFRIEKQKTITVSAITTDWHVRLQSLEPVNEGNQAYVRMLTELKAASAVRFPKKTQINRQKQMLANKSNDTCVVMHGFEGNAFGNSLPNDNTLAISNNGMLISNINSSIYIYDIPNDTLLKAVSLATFSDTLSLNPSQYDPKLLYDPSADKFVMVYLAGHVDTTSNIVVAFSQTNNPMGNWNIYALPGNPLSDTSWSDFPAIALTQGELFITVNLLKPNGSWQTSFKQSVVWQIDKQKGYTGQSLDTKLWSGIKTGNRPLRNIHPIQGGSALVGPDIYLLSNRNFAIQCDTLFLIHISNVLSDTNATLSIQTLIADKSYGMPPNADQPANQTFATNDARVLGGFIENNRIQFVGNTIDTLSGLATFYHGILNNPAGTPTVHLHLMADTVEMGYPNISYSGNSATDNSALISVNYSGKFTFPGFCAFHYDGSTAGYSKRTNLKSGNSHVNFFSGTDPERWGDYSGNQRVYNEPGKVWVSGTFGKKKNSVTRVNATWIAGLYGPAYSGVQNQEVEKLSMMAYPNPVFDLMFVEFTLAQKSTLNINLYNASGVLVSSLWQGEAGKGKNLFSFNTQPLSKGLYLLVVNDGSNTLMTKKLIKE